MISKEVVYAMLNTLYENDLLPVCLNYEDSKDNYDIAEKVVEEYNERLDKLKTNKG